MLGKKLISARSHNLTVFGRNLTTLEKENRLVWGRGGTWLG